MEQLTLFLKQNLPETVVIAINVICYILYVVINIKVKKSGRTLHTLVKEKVVYIDKENNVLKQSMREEINILRSELKKSNENVEDLKKQMSSLEKRVKKSDNVLKSMIEEDIQ